VLLPDALIDLGSVLWKPSRFTAVLLGHSDIPDLPLSAPRHAVEILRAIPITANEAAWVRLKGAGALRETWLQDGVDTYDPAR
jgi:hypothetical protein